MAGDLTGGIFLPPTASESSLIERLRNTVSFDFGKSATPAPLLPSSHFIAISCIVVYKFPYSLLCLRISVAACVFVLFQFYLLGVSSCQTLSVYLRKYSCFFCVAGVENCLQSFICCFLLKWRIPFNKTKLV